MKNKLLAAGLGIFLSAGFVAESLAQSVNGMVNTRKGAMALQGKYMFQLVNIVQGKAPYDAATVQRNADYLAVLTTMPWEDFQPATAGAQNTRAKDDIYKDAPKFKSSIEKLQSEIKVLQTAARGGNQATVGAAVKNAAQTCNACHEAFTSYNGRFRFE